MRSDNSYNLIQMKGSESHMMEENSLYGLGVLLCFLWVWSLTSVTFKGNNMRKCPEISF